MSLSLAMVALGDKPLDYSTAEASKPWRKVW